MNIYLTVKKGQLIPLNKEEHLKVLALEENTVLEVKEKPLDRRTLAQNASIHKWCEMIAIALNKENVFIQDIIKINTKWNMIKVKEMLFKPVVKSLYTKDSTTKLHRDEFDLIIDTLTRYMGQKGIILPPFPNKEY